MFSTTFVKETAIRTTEHTIEVVTVDGEFAVKSTTRILVHSNPRLVGRETTAILDRRYKTERGATSLADDIVRDYQKFNK